MPHIYETNGAAIYEESFRTIRAEAEPRPIQTQNRRRDRPARHARNTIELPEDPHFVQP